MAFKNIKKSTIRYKLISLRILCFISLVLLVIHQASAVETDPKIILQQLKEATQKLNSYSVIHIQQERFGDKMGATIKMKVKYSQGRVYLKILEGPKKNAELLFLPGSNDNKVKVHKGSFPDLTLNLDSHSSLLLEDQHHPIEHMSFRYIVGTVFESIDRCSTIPGAHGKYLRNEKSATSSSDVIELMSPWQETIQVVEKDDDIWTFAKRFKVDPFVILHSNGYHEFDSLSEGKKMTVPRCYASKTVLEIDEQTHLLTKLNTYDKNGDLYESYQWQQLDTATPILDIDFDPKNPDYDF